MTTTVTGSTLADRIEESLEGLVPGQRLASERQLAAQFHVGRPLVREALRTLVARGIVDVQVGRGSFVRQVAPGDVARPVGKLLRRQSITARQLVEARSTLESEAVGLPDQIPPNWITCQSSCVQGSAVARCLPTGTPRVPSQRCASRT